MTHFFTYIVILLSPVLLGLNNVENKILEIDKYAIKIDRNLKKFKRVHLKEEDCHGNDTYFRNRSTVAKVHNYQEKLYIDYYYKNNQLVLVEIVNSFKKGCNGYCDTVCVFDYMGKIYYYNNEILKIVETGSKPCCPIESRTPPLNHIDSTTFIDFNEKAEIFLKLYGTEKTTINIERHRKPNYSDWY